MDGRTAVQELIGQWRWKVERGALRGVALTVLLALGCSALVYHGQRQRARAALACDARQAAELLAALPASQARPARLLLALRDERLAWAELRAADGLLLASLPADAAAAPPQAAVTTRIDWRGDLLTVQRRLPQGRLALAYRLPGPWPAPADWPALLAPLLVALAAGLAFFLYLRREVRPLRELADGLRVLLERREPARLVLPHAGPLHELVLRLNELLGIVGGRLRQLESERRGLSTSAQVLVRRRQRAEAVLQSLPDGALVLDETGLPAAINGQAAHLLETSPEAVVGQPARRWCHQPEVLSLLARFAQDGAVAWCSQQLDYHPRQQPERKIRLFTFPLFSPVDETSLLGSLVLFRDITEEELARTSRAEFVAHVVHELKSPLNVLAMYSEALQGEDGADPGFRAEACNAISDEVERLSGLIANLLSLTRIEMGGLGLSRQWVHLHALLEDVHQHLARQAKTAGVRLLLDVPRELPPVSVDKALFTVAINNLLSNAIKYNRPGGTVTLSARETERSIFIRVRDTGIGIAPEEQQRIFEKFYRAEDAQVRQRAGHGLGLPLAREVIQLHHGVLSVESRPGEGTTFIIELAKEAGMLKQAI